MFESYCLKLLLPLQLEIHIVFTATPSINSLCKNFWLKEVFDCQKVKKQIPSFFKLYSIYGEITEEFLDETDVDS